MKIYLFRCFSHLTSKGKLHLLVIYTIEKHEQRNYLLEKSSDEGRSNDCKEDLIVA